MNTLQYEFNNGVLKVVLGASSGAAGLAEVQNLLNKYADVKTVDVDMHNCLYIQSKALAELIALKKMASKMKAELALLNLPEQVTQTLEMTNLRSLFVLKEDYSVYSVDELCEKFLSYEDAQNVSDYLARNYDTVIRGKLIEILQQNDPIQAEYALLTMGRAQDYESTEIFRRELESPFQNVKVAAILVLGWIGDVASKPKVYSYLEDDDIDTAEAAAASIALLSDETDSDKLAKYLDCPKSKVRILAAQALALIGDDKAFAYIKGRLAKETEDEVRVSLVKQFSLFNKPEVAEMIVKCLGDSFIAVKEAAASSLARIGAGQHAELILSKVTDDDTWVGFFAAKALEGVSDKAVVGKLLELYPNLAHNVQLAVIEVAGRSKEINKEFFTKLTSDENEDIRKEALCALAASGAPEAVDFALRMYDKDPSWIVRYTAADIILEHKPVDYEILLKNRLKKEDNRYVREKLIASVGE